jgi:ribose transport system substrate-binding protein
MKRFRLDVSRRCWPLLFLSLFVGCGEKIAQEPSAANPASGAPAGQSEAKAKGDGKAKRLILLTNGNSPFFDACRAGLQDAEKELQLAEAGFAAVFEVNNGTPEGQLDKLKQYGSQADVAGVALSAVDANNAAIADEMRKLKQKGVQVITVDSDVDRETLRDARSAFVGTDNLAGGKALGICAKGLRPDGGEFVTFVGRLGAQNAIERIGGFAQGAGEAFQSADSMADDFDLNRARDNVRNAIRNHPDVKTLVGIWSYNAPAIVDVVTELDRRADFTIVTFDAEPGAITMMGQGKIDAMVVQNPYAMGFESMRLLKALASGDDVKGVLPKFGEPDGDIFDTGLKVVVPNADSPLKKDQFSDNVEFLMLDQFQKWLDKYGLSGS